MNDSDMQVDPITTVTAATFERMVLQADRPVAVEFMSYACAHCGAIEPALQHAAAVLATQERVFRVNIALDPDLARSFAIQGTPTIVLFRGGREAGRVEGPLPTQSSVLAALTDPFEA
jgi:thioredoxin-like negative regulator of GroEL